MKRILEFSISSDKNVVIVLGSVLTIVMCSCIGKLYGPLKPIATSPEVRLEGVAQMASDGTLIFSVAKSLKCERRVVSFNCKENKRTGMICAEQIREERKEQVDDCDTKLEYLTVTPPWQDQSITAAVDEQKRATFVLDWRKSGLAEEGVDPRTVLKEPWYISGDIDVSTLEWSPDDDAITIMLQAISQTAQEKPLDTRPSEITVITPKATSNVMNAGAFNRLEVTLRNEGPGIAYDVEANTKSGILKLHNQDLEFGQLEPGAEETRVIEVDLEPAPKPSTEWVVVFVTWKNGNQLLEEQGTEEIEHQARFTIHATPKKRKVPKLSLVCEMEKPAQLDNPTVRAGQEASFSCLVRNVGNASAHKVQVAAALAGNTVRRSLRKKILPGRNVRVEMDLPIPKDPELHNKQVEIKLSVVAKGTGKPVTFNLTATVKGKRRCRGRQISTDDYKRKRAALEAARARGSITEGFFNEQMAYWVSCLE